jgi:hypothetical protein
MQVAREFDSILRNGCKAKTSSGWIGIKADPIHELRAFLDEYAAEQSRPSAITADVDHHFVRVILQDDSAP